MQGFGAINGHSRVAVVVDKQRSKRLDVLAMVARVYQYKGSTIPMDFHVMKLPSVQRERHIPSKLASAPPSFSSVASPSSVVKIAAHVESDEQ